MAKVKKNSFNLSRFFHPDYTAPLFLSLFIFFLVKTFLLDVVKVQSPSMGSTLKQGELVFVAKTFTPKLNDVVRLYVPLSNTDSGVVSAYVFKRVAGTPGDTVEIRGSKLIVNGKFLPENDIFLHNYVVKVKVQSDSILFDKADIKERYLLDDSCVYLVSLTEKRFSELNEQKIFPSIISNAEDSGDHDPNVFPFESSIKWNEDYFGPLYIPGKGDTLLLDSNTCKFYKRIIVDFENNKMERVKEVIFINGIAVNFYVCKQNYYFVTGDHFDNSIDSRNWGYIPAKKIKGKVLFKN